MIIAVLISNISVGHPAKHLFLVLNWIFEESDGRFMPVNVKKQQKPPHTKTPRKKVTRVFLVFYLKRNLST